MQSKNYNCCRPVEIQLASFKLPGFPQFDPIGLKFSAKTQSGGGERFFFWVPRYKDKTERLFRWIPQSSSWKEVQPSKLSDKRRAKLMECWQAQEDIGMWISHSKRLAGRY